MDNGRGSGGGGWGLRGRGSGSYNWRWAYKKRGNNGSYRGGRGRGQGSGGDAGDTGQGSDGSSPQPGSSYGSGGGGGGRGRGRGNKWSSGGGGRGSGSNGSSSNYDSPPPRKKKRTDALQAIKTSVEKQWRVLLPGYDLYYGDGPPQLPETDKKVAAVVQYLLQTPFVDNVAGCEKTRDDDFEGEESYFSLRYEEVMNNQQFCELWPEFSSDLVGNPEQTITLWSAAAHKVMHDAVLLLPSSEDDSDSKSKPPTLSKIRMGYFKPDPVTPLISLKSDHIGKFVTIRGSVISAGNPHSFCSRMTFRCKFCSGEFAVKQLEGKYTYPTKCKATDECSNTFTFEPLPTAPTTLMLDSRRIRIQDMLHCDIERGTVPKTIDCMLFGTWSDMCTTGDVITLSGIVKMSDLNQSVCHTYIDVSAIQQQKESEHTMGGHSFSFTDKDYCAVKEIHDEPRLFRLLVASLCPAIYGHELVKAGLLLCLFGGTSESEGMVNRRSDINMLMMGDPGIGKSQMLKVIAEVAPKAVYMCGTGSTAAGLTVALVNDGNDYSLEAGALVMADNGICCIDEFDKMSNQHHALLEAMEQQSVSVAKSGIHRSLPARTTVIAAANPVGGHYNPCKTVTENIKIKPAVLSRFDLIFILLDRPNKEFDERLVAHKVALRMGTTNRTSALASGQPGRSGNVNSSDKSSESLKLIDRIKVPNGEVVDIIPHALLRKYIAYAKWYVHPKLSPQASELLKKYYMSLRVRRAPDTTPITARQLESLVRLAQARAKIELREEVTAQDASDVLEIFEFSLSSSYDEEVLAMSALSDSVLLNSSSTFKKPKSMKDQAKRLLLELQRIAEQQSKNRFSIDDIKLVAGSFGCKDKYDSLITMLNMEGFLLQKGGRNYELRTKDL